MKGIYLLLFLPIVMQLNAELYWQTKQDGFTVLLQLSKETLALDESLHLQAEIHHPSNYSPQIQHWIEQLTKPVNPLKPIWSLIQQDIQEKSSASGTNTIKLNLTLAPLKEGPLPLSFLILTFANSDQSYPLATPVFTIKVIPPQTISPLNDMAPLAPLEPQYPMHLNTANQELMFGKIQLTQEALQNQQIMALHRFPWLFVLLVILASGFGIFWKFFKPIYFPAPLPPLPTFEDIRNKGLRSLERIHIQQDCTQLYSTLTSFLRSYLERQFNIPSHFQTTDELLQYISDHAIFSKTDQKNLNTFFFHADQVKFGLHQPNRQECENAYNETKQLIQSLALNK